MANKTQKYWVPLENGERVDVHCTPQTGMRIIELMKQSGQKFPDGNALTAFVVNQTVPANMQDVVRA